MIGTQNLLYPQPNFLYYEYIGILKFRYLDLRRHIKKKHFNALKRVVANFMITTHALTARQGQLYYNCHNKACHHIHPYFLDLSAMISLLHHSELGISHLYSILHTIADYSSVIKHQHHVFKRCFLKILLDLLVFLVFSLFINSRRN